MSEKPQPPAPAKGGRSKMLLVAGAVVAVVAGGAGYWFMQRPAAAEQAHHEEPAPKRGIVGFDPFVVNLADQGVSRFLRASVQLVVKDPEQATEMEESKVDLMQARSAVLDVLSTQKSDVLVTPEGKAALRASILEKLHGTLHEIEVVDVLFSDFVVQF